MSIIIRKMTDEEYQSFCHWSVAQQAKELMEERSIPHKQAMLVAEAEVLQMLPDGLHTAHNHLIAIEEQERKELAGFIWTIHEETSGRKQSFICDFVIFDSKRRRGYAKETLRLVNENAAKRGCLESVLFVADRNDAARELYLKCGYQFLRHAHHGQYMVKRLY